MMAEGEEGNEFVQRNLLKMAIQLSKELPRKRISRRRVQYLKKACRGKMDHVCGEQDFNHQLPRFFSTQVHANHLFKVAKCKGVSEGMDRKTRPPLWCLQWSKDLTTICKRQRRHHPQGKQKNCPGSSKGLIRSKEIKTKYHSMMTSHELWESQTLP